jgi:hypothetical protein
MKPRFKISDGGLTHWAHRAEEIPPKDTVMLDDITYCSISAVGMLVVVGNIDCPLCDSQAIAKDLRDGP